MRLLRLAAILFVALAAAVAFPLSSTGQASADNTWAGTWSTDFGEMTLSAGGSGSYKGFNPGTVSGTIKGNLLEGRWNQPGNPPKKGTFKFTMSADGRSFSGSFAYDNSTGCTIAGCGWNGHCIAGPCMNNSPTGNASGGAQAKPVKVTLSVKPPNGSYGPSARVEVGVGAVFRAVVSPTLPAGAKVIIGRTGAMLAGKTCGASPCLAEAKAETPISGSYQAWVFSASNQQLATSATVTVVWEAATSKCRKLSGRIDPRPTNVTSSSRLLMQTTGCTVEFGARLPQMPKGRYTRSVVVDAGTWVDFKALAGNPTAAPETSKIVIRIEPQGRVFKTCDQGDASCRFRARLKQPGGKVEFQAFVMDGNATLATSQPVTVVWEFELDYTVPPRFWAEKNTSPHGMIDRDGNGLADEAATAKKGSVGAVEPASWPVDLELTGGKCPQAATATATYRAVSGSFPAAEQPLPVTQRPGCVWRALFPGANNQRSGEGIFQVTLEIKTASGAMFRGTKQVMVQDWLVIGVGDSMGSGEGNPAFPAAGGNPARWQDELQGTRGSTRCNRSVWSHQARAALELELNDPKTSVTFVHLACSGASITIGVTGEYEGVNKKKPGETDLPAQTKVARGLVGVREVDAVLVSVGVNDLGFGPVLRFCADPRRDSLIGNDCSRAPYLTAPSLDAYMKDRIKQLRENWYDDLNIDFQIAPAFPPARVFITQYPELLNDGQGQLCRQLPGLEGGYGLAGVTKDEIEWMQRYFLKPLNAEVAAAAAQYKWNLVPIGAPGSPFEKRGYCANDHWVVQKPEAEANQGNEFGTMHPNQKGHEFMGQLVYKALYAKIYPGRKARKPAK